MPMRHTAHNPLWSWFGRVFRYTAGLAGVAAIALFTAVLTAQAQVNILGGKSGGGASNGATTAALQAASDAAKAAQNSINALTRATQAIQAMRTAQSAARGLAVTAPTSVTNGLSPGGLVVDPRVVAGTDPTLWVDAGKPTETTNNGQTTVTIEQQAQRAILTWQQFNVGRDTTVHFDQSAGNSANGNSWTALNRIDATGNPSQILGSIKAEGTVLLINPNGIIFNGSSQINIHSLIASAMDLNSFTGTANGAFKATGPAYVPILVDGLQQRSGSGTTILAPSDEANANKVFLSNGLFVNNGFQLPGTRTSTGAAALFSAGFVPGQSNAGVLVEAGASIATDVSGFDNGGLVALLGPQVSNAGSIETKAGSIILAAGASVQITEPAPGSAQTTFVARTALSPELRLLYDPPAVAGGSFAVNEAGALLVSRRGNITLIGDEVQQLGAAEATTSITRAGSITIAAVGTPDVASPELGLTLFGEGSVTAILPEENGETIPSDSTSLASFVAPRIDVSAPYVDFQSNSLVYAPSATMTVTGPGQGNGPGGEPPLPVGRVLMEAGSTIDLSGLTAYRSVSDYLYTFKVTANDVADTPLAKSLIGQTVTIDLSQTGTRSDGETWVGSPLFASSGAGYLSNISQGIDQLLSKGGTLSFGSGYAVTNGNGSAAFNDVLQAPGAVVNVSGGTIQYTGATIATTHLVGSDGRTYDIGKADPFISYQGFAGTYTVDHWHWGQKDVYANPLYSGSYYKAGYTNGISAGSVAIAAVNPILEGDLVGDIVIGTQQRQLAQAATGTGGSQLTPDQLPSGAALSITLAGAPGGANISLTHNAVILDDTAPNYLAPGASMTSALALPTNADGVPVVTYSTDRLSGYNLGSITISGADTLAMTQGAHLSGRDGGSIKLAAATTIDGTLTAHGGSITISGATASSTSAYDGTLASLVIGPHALLDVSGRWINDTGHYGDDFAGALYINGGGISLSTTSLSKVLSYNSSTKFVTAEDRSPSLLLQDGSVIDVSSGGYVGTSGKLALGSDGLPKGKGGNLSLLTYTGEWINNFVDPEFFDRTRLNYAPQVANAANVVMDGTIYAGGLSQGGTFTLQAPAISIDGNATEVAAITSGAAKGTLVLPPSFFTSGFGSYKLTSVYGSMTVTAGTTLTLKQQNYLAASMASLSGTGARMRDFATPGYAPDGMRHAVDLALTESAYNWGAAGDRSATAQLLIAEGASILADPKANITLASGGPTVILGSVTAHGGSISINQGFNPSYALTHDGLPQYLWVGPHAVLDASGTFVPNPLIARYSTGSVLSGGAITLSSPGVIVAQAGSRFDISGASATVEVPNAAEALRTPPFTTQEVWSNAGSLTLSTSGTSSTGWYHSLYFAGTIKAAGGVTEAAGGTLNISSSGGILVSQSGDVAASFAQSAAPTTRTQLTSLLPTTIATSFITADTINTANSGLDSVSFTGPLYFSGNIDLKVAGSILIDSPSALALLPDAVSNTAYTVPACTPVGNCIPTIGGTNVTLDAGYIRFANSSGSTPTVSSANVPKLADGTLTLKASQHIDLVGVLAVNNAGTVNLVSGGDIRLIGTGNFGAATSSAASFDYTSDGYGAMPWVGGLLVADNLNITAREIYPTTDTAFLLMSLGLAPASAAGTHNTITFASNGATPVTPLSAGGAILVDAKSIVQGGALYAPLGIIQLGFGAGQTLPAIFVSGATNDPYSPVQTGGFSGLYGTLITTVATGSVTLLPGSLTSVSANGLLIPYGATTDGTDWTDNNTLLNGPPAKLIVLGGSNIDTQAGAIIDGRGGGDVYATEFVPGTGGSRNVLTNSNQTVYALVPGYSSGLAPYDPSFTTSVAAGTTVTLPGGNGIAAGTYTLLPAEYATLPGAYRVVVASTNASPYAQTFATPDGSVYMTGVLGNAINGSSSSQTGLLQIQSKATWTKYSEIDIATGNSYFAQLAATKGTAVARLAQDAARISVAATTSLALNATNLFGPASGGLGGQLDITGTNLVVAASDKLGSFGSMTNGSFTPGSAYAGYLFLDADMLSGLGIESTLIGGYRSNTSEGTLITATALNLEIATDAAHPLTGPEMLLTSLAPTSASRSVRGLVVDDDSVITASGTVAGKSSAALVFGADPVATYNTDGSIKSWSAGVSGDGALLRVSNGGLVDVIRHFVPGVYQVPATTPAPAPPVSTVARGNLAIGNGVALTGNTLTLDSSGSTTLAQSASLNAKNYDLSGSVINLGGGTGGLVVTTDLIGKLVGADAVRLRSASVFNLYGNNTFGDTGNRIGTLTLDGAGLYSDGGTTTITAGNIVLANSQATANTNGANTSGSGGSLSLDASGTLTFGKGVKSLSGFATVSATAGTQALFTGTGSLDAKGANVTLTAPLFLADRASAQSLTTTGLLTLAQGRGTAPAIDPTLIGGALSFTGGSIDASATLIAQGGKLTLEALTGDLNLSGNALLSAAGTRVTIGDLIQDTPAGSIRLYADAGNVTLGSGTTVDVSGAGSGYAGSLAVYAAKTAGLDGTLRGGARCSDLGGTFALIADKLAGGMPINAGFTRSFEVSLGHGDIALGAGQTLKSENVLLVANNGGVFVDGTIDARSASGGTIGLYGAGTSTAAAGTADASGVTIGSGAKLIARYQAPDKDSPGYAGGTATNVQRGGTITLGTTGTPDGTLDPTYGYRNVPRSGAITVASGATFDVSGGPGGDSIDNTGGSVIIRAPILANRAINVSFKGTVVTNAKPDGSASGSPLIANAFAVWSTTDASTDPNKHFDGIIDPAGFFDASGARLISADANGLYPTSTAASPASGAYTPHVNFYQTTLLNFVNNPFDTNAVAANFAGAKLQVGSNAATAMPASALHLRPEIDLVNPSTAVNNGNITVASNWNFGAGSYDNNGNPNLFYRTTNGGEPGTLVLRAANNVKINATISDGFFLPSAASLYQAYLAMFVNGALVYDASGDEHAFNLFGDSLTNYGFSGGFSVPANPSFFGSMPQNVFDTLQFQLQAPTVLSCGGSACAADVIDQYDQYYAQYVSMFNAYVTEIVSLNSGGGGTSIVLGTPSVTGGTLMSYSNYANFMNQGWGQLTLDPNSLQIPDAPTLSSQYYDIKYGLGQINYAADGSASTTASDYATQWAAYFFSVANLNINNTYYGGMSLSQAVGGVPTLSKTPGAAASSGAVAAVAVTPPFAPPAYTKVQLDYRPSSEAPPPPVPPANTIANNPSIFNGTNVFNTTSSAPVMTAAVSGAGSFSYDFVGGALFNADGTSSVNPNAVVQLSSPSSTVTGNVTIDGHTSYTNPLTNLTVNVPTLVRTGTGSITLTAAGDFALLDQVAPGTVYTAGYVADNASGFTAPTLPNSLVSSGLLTTPVWGTGGGDIIVTAGRDIIGIETPVDPTGTQFPTMSYLGNISAGVSTGQFWSAWYYVNGKSTGSSTAPFDPTQGGQQYSSWINYGTFFQGFGALGGGNITLEAGRNVQDVSASLPETIQVSGGQSASGPAAAAHYYGGGDLLVEAGNDVLSGVYYVGRGTGLIRAGGDAIADATLYSTYYSYGAPTTTDPYSGTKTPRFSVPLLLAVQDSQISMQAAGSITLGGIFQPTRLPAELATNLRTLPANIGAAFDSYGANSGVSLTSSTGSIAVEAPETNTLFTHVTGGYGFIGGASPANIIAPNLSVTALTGDVDLVSGYKAASLSLYPAATGELSLIAGGSINDRTLANVTASVSMLDIGDTTVSLLPMLGSPLAALTDALHTGDATSVLIYAGEDINSGTYTLPKKARVWAGRDILNINFTGMNTSADDITSIVAGRDILASRLPDVIGQIRQGTRSIFTLYGPGDFVIEAGRNLGPFSTSTAADIAAYPGYYRGGIFAVGNGANSGDTVKPYLPRTGANITARYGVAGGIDYAAAISTYGDAATAASSGIDVVSRVIPELERLLADLIVEQAKASGIANPSVTVTLTAAEAADVFNALPTLAINGKLAALAEKAGLNGLSFNLTPSQFLAVLQTQEAMKVQIDRSFLGLLTQVSLDYNDASSSYYQQYARAYQAIATLFPASLGYTDNGAGGTSVTPVLKHTGDLRMARTLVETQTGGDINILGAGGNLYVGSNSADELTPEQQGILTLQGGSVRTYTDESVLIYQSRIFTEQGGNVEMFSANGDLNAGKGPKSSAAYPPLQLICDVNGFCRVNPAGLVTGAGIGALLSVAGQDPAKSNVVLTAPHGIIDAGAAGIRVSGNLNLVAVQVLNAFNVDVGGTAVGIPTFQAPNVGGLTQASNTGGAAVKDVTTPTQSAPGEQPSIIIVEVIGYGGDDGSSEPAPDDKRRKREKQSQMQDPHSRYQVVGAGLITEGQAEELAEEKRKQVGR